MKDIIDFYSKLVIILFFYHIIFIELFAFGTVSQETAFRSLEEFRIRTCDVGKELVLVLLSLECLVRSWRTVKLWEFYESLLEGLEVSRSSRGKRSRARVLSRKCFSLKSS